MATNGKPLSAEHRRKISESEKGVKKKVSPEGRKVRSEHGRKVLQEWKDRTPGQGKVTHGLTSKTVRQRYSDGRTSEGKALREILDGLITDLGGPAELTTAHHVLLSSIKSKLIVLLQLSKFADESESIVDSEGKLLPALANHFIGYTESLRRDIETLYGVRRKDKVARYDYQSALRRLDVVK